MLNELHPTLLHSEELSTVSERIRGLVAAQISEMPLISQLQQLIAADVADLGEALQRSRSSEFTALLQEKDARRDDAFVAFRDFVKACSNRSVPEVAAAGRQLTGIVKKHGWTLYAKGYIEESALLAMLLNELASEPAASAIQTLNATQWHEELKSAQAAFEETYNNKVTTEAQEDFPLVRTSHAKLSRHVVALLDCVGILAETDEAGTYASLVGELNEVITDVMSLARARRTRDEKPGSEPQPA